MDKWLNENVKELLTNHNGLRDEGVKKFNVSREVMESRITDWFEDKVYFQEDFIIQQECEDCGWSDDEPEEDTECPECESANIMNYTSHEGLECNVCEKRLDMWEDAYVDTSEGNMYCESCVRKIEHTLDSFDN